MFSYCWIFSCLIYSNFPLMLSYLTPSHKSCGIFYMIIGCRDTDIPIFDFSDFFYPRGPRRSEVINVFIWYIVILILWDTTRIQR